MPLNKLENFIKNYEGRILYVNSNDLDATDSITNQGNSLTKPFKTIQRAVLEAARFSFVAGNNNDKNDRTTILVYPGEHVVDNRPGYGIRKIGTALAEAEAPNGTLTSPATDEFNLTLESVFDLTQEDNVLYKFNSIHGGVILPRGTSIIGLDLRKTKIRAKYIPNPTDSAVPNTSIFRITGACFFWNFSFFDANENELVYTNNRIFTAGSGNLSIPTFSHHKLTCFEYADGVNVPTGYDITDLDMYYAKISNAFNEGSGRSIPGAQKWPLSPLSFAKERPEWEIVGAFGTDPVNVSSMYSGDGATPSPIVTVETIEDHGLTAGTPIKIRGSSVADYNITSVVQTVLGPKTFTYQLLSVRNDLPALPSGSITVTIETDTVKGASPYIFNCSLRSVWGMNGMHADGSKASGFRSMVVAQFTGVSLQRDDRAFVKYNPITRTYAGIPITRSVGTLLSSGSSSTNTSTVYHLDSSAIYRRGWETSHIKCSNDSIIQVVSVFAIGYNKHFDAESGGDQSITNSNSNFGQYSLAADGFKKEAFNKDDYGYVTSIITPKSVPTAEEDIDWISINVGLTTAVGISSHLYLFGFNSQDNVPPNLIAGYRVGARLNDVLYLDLPNGSTVSAPILMSDNILTVGGSLTPSGTSSAIKEYSVGNLTSAPNYDTLTLTTSHALQTGEKIIIISDTGDLPENITEHKLYYAIRVDSGSIKIASSFSNAQNNVGIKMYGGSQLRVLSRVSDKSSGELGSPIQYDPNNNNWFIYVEANNSIYSAIDSLGVAGFEEPRTDVTYFKRIPDSRSLDEKIYKLRIVIPKEAPNGKDPQDGFVIQESSSTGAISDVDFTLSSISKNDYNFKRNYRFISTCTQSSGTVTVITEGPHNLNIGDRVFIKNVRSSTNISGIGITGYNGDFTVTATPDSYTFRYSTTDINGLTHNVGIFSGPTSRTTSLPRYERNDLRSNFFIYRSEVISPYIYNTQDGIYHSYVLKADNAVPDHFTDYKYNQNIVNLYPQQDRDNANDNPQAAASFAKRAPLGDVVTNDLKKSITRETLNAFIRKFGVAPTIQSVTPVISGICTITTTFDHGLNGIVGFTTLNTGLGYTNDTYYDVKLLNQDNSWNGARATVVVSGVGNSITSLRVTQFGSGYKPTDILKVDGFTGSTIGITSSVISIADDNSLQVTGVGTGQDGLYRILNIPSKNQIAIARTSGDPSISINQYALNVYPSITISSVTSNAGISTVTCSSPHGLVSGNRFRILDNNNNNLGDYIIESVVGVNTFTVSSRVEASSFRILKHGFASNDLTSDSGGENLGSRGVSFYGNETAILLTDLTSDTSIGISTFPIRVTNSGISTTTRFPIGSFIQIDNEIMRVANSTLSGSGNNEITVIRSYLGTQKENHSFNSLIKKINPIPIELRRPSILRASGHTFEYLGFGPGNYSTGLPQIQVKTLTEREDFLTQSQEKSCGNVVYTGMNSDGDFFIGNTKYSSASGQQITFDIPIPTITGQDPSRLSVVFDEAIIKERILVEGGKSKQILSQFDGPVTFNNKVILNNETKVTGELILSNILKQNNVTDSTAVNNGAIVVKGGVGIAKTVNIGGNLNVIRNVSIGGTTVFNGEVQFNSGLVPDSIEDAYIGSAAKPWASGWIGGIGIATAGVPGGREIEDRTISALTGDLVLSSVGIGTSVVVNSPLCVNRNAIITGILTVGTRTVTLDGAANEIRIGAGATIGIDPITGALRFTSGGGPAIFDNVNVDGNLTVTLNTTLNGTNTFNGATTVTQLLTATNSARIDNVTIDDNTVTTSTGELILDSTAGTVRVNDILNATLTSVLQGEVTVNTGIVPDADGAYLGTAALPFTEASVGRLRLAVGTGAIPDGTITTGTGNLFLNAASDTVQTSANLQVGEAGANKDATVFGNAIVRGAAGTTFLSVRDGANTEQASIQCTTGNIQTSGLLRTTNTSNATSATDANASFRTAGGAAIASSLWVGGTSNFGNTLTVSSGGLSVTGSATISNGLTVSAGGINASGQTVTANRFQGTADSAGVADNVRAGGTNRVLYSSSGDSNTTDDSSNLTFNGSDLSCSGNITAGGELRSNNDVVAYFSDERLKENIKIIPSALSKILQLRGVTYNSNSLAEKYGYLDKKEQVGVIAQEVQKVLPQVISPAPFDIEIDKNGNKYSKSGENYMTVKYEKIVPLLIEAIKELNEKVEILQQRLEDK